MPRKAVGALVLTLVVWVGGKPSSVLGASEALLPDSTRGFLSITDVKVLSEHWDKTQLGQLVKDPVMKPFVEDIRRQFDERWTAIRQRLGLTIEDLQDVPGGEVAVAAIQPGPGKHATAIVVDITGHKSQAEGILKKVEASMTRQGAKRRQVQSAGATLVVYDIPPRDTPGAPAGPRQAIYFLRENMLVVCDDLGVIQGIVSRLAGQKGSALADVPAFQAVMKRCQKDAGKAVPQVRWWVQPIGYMEVVQAASAERSDRPRRKRTLLDAFRKQGFDGIQGVGGYVDFAAEGADVFHRTLVYAPKPHRLAMKMLVFPNAKQFAPQRWVPRDVAAYASFYADVPNAFDNFGPLFDELYGEGEPGFWNDILLSLERDPDGPRINLRQELVVYLGPRISVLTDYQLPITTTSERLLFAIEVKNEDAVDRALTKLFKNDVEMRQHPEPVPGHKRAIWEAVPHDASSVPSVTLDLPPIGPGSGAKGPAREEQPLLPHQAMTVAHGHLLIASHVDFLKKVLLQSDEKTSLGQTVEYRIVEKALRKIAPEEHAAAIFNRTDETYRPTYELIRQGKMPESEMLLGRLLNTLLGPGTKGVPRKQEIEGSKMPEFDYVRRHLSPAGAVVISEEDGWFIKGFMLGKP